MRAGGGKTKGAEFERFVCKKLSLWITNGRKDDVFWRSAMSGGRATIGRGRSQKRSNQVGDISAIGKEGIEFLNTFMVECKNYKDLNLASFLFKHSGKLFEFWEVAKKLAKKHDRIPLLICKQNLIPPFAMTTARGSTRLFEAEHFLKVDMGGAPVYFYWLEAILLS